MLSLRRHRVKLYAYSHAFDAASMGVAVSTYTRVLSGAADGNWWAARGVTSSRETAPTTAAQHEQTAVWGMDRGILVANPTISADGVLVDAANRVWRITAVEDRITHGQTVQLHTVTVDDANASFALVEPPPEAV
jgi:hypothetical protein